MAARRESPEQIRQREYRDRFKNISADRLVPYETYSLRLVMEELSANLGKRLALIENVLIEGLAAIALAASTPEDNSAAVKEFTERIRKQVDLLKAAEQQTKGE